MSARPRLWVVKLGSGLLTAQSGKIDQTQINQLVAQISAIRKNGVQVVLVSSGAVSAGMTALDLPPVDPLPDDLQRYYEVCEEKLGMIPNVLAVYGFEPDRLRGFSQMYNALMLGESELSKAEREMIAVVVSAQNQCHYCLVAHGATLRQLTGDPALADTIAANYRHAAIDHRQRAMLDFAVKVTKASAEIGEEDRQTLRDAGFSDRGIWDVAEVAAFFNMSNRMSSAVAMKPNDVYYGMAR